MSDTLEKLLKIEKEYGFEIFFDKQRATALIKDFFAESKRELKLLEKGIELNIYKKIINMPITDILIIKTALMKELCDDHGLSENAAEYTIDIWIRMVEKNRHIKILESYTPAMKNALKAYKKNLEKTENHSNKPSVTYDNAPPNQPIRLSKKRLKTQVLKLKKSITSTNKPNKIAVSEPIPDKRTQNVLGSTLYNLQKYEDAVAMFKDGAERGDLMAQNNLAYCYLYGKGVEKNVDLALTWFLKAAHSGEITAMVNIANCYYGGIGVRRDVSKALPWYAKAATLGDASSQYILGECFYRGEGVAKSKIEAVKWFEKASAQHHTGAMERLEELNYYASILRSRAKTDKEKQYHKNTEISAHMFAERMVSRIISEPLMRCIQIQSDDYDLTSAVRNGLLGLASRLDANEYPVFLYTDFSSKTIRQPDTALFTTNGLYIKRYLRRTRFLYYADVIEVKSDDNAKRKIWINKYFINCSTLENDSICALIKIINDTIREFR